MSRYAHVQHNIKEPSVIHLIINIFVKAIGTATEAL